MRIQLLGLCRFSVPSRGAFQVSHDSIEARRAMLYDPARLAQRFAWLEQVALPGLRGQTDADFTLVVLLGEDFPEPWLGRMRALVAGLPQARLAFAPPGEHREVCAAAMRPHLDKAADWVAQFRLDDDDGLAFGFMQRVRRDLRQIAGMADRHKGLALDYGRGFVLRDLPEALQIEPVQAQCWAPGLAIALPPDDGRFVLDFPHHKVWRRLPVLGQMDQVMFLRGAHDANDSVISSRGALAGPDHAAAAAQIAARFGVDVAALRAALLQARGGAA